jgi:hypothetical protein
MPLILTVVAELYGKFSSVLLSKGNNLTNIVIANKAHEESLQNFCFSDYVGEFMSF